VVNTYVIIGAGAAGINAARTLRMLDANAKIIVLSNEQVLPYNKCFLVSVLSGQKTKESLFLYPEKYYREQSIELELGCTIKSINTELQTLFYKTNQQEKVIEYTKLLIASGARARRFYQSQNRWYQFHTLENLDCVLQELKINKPQSCIIIGGGVTGLECSDALVKRGLQVSIITPEVLPSFGSASVLKHSLKQLLLQQNIKIYKSAIQSAVCENNTNYLKLVDGTIVTGDFVITTCGVARNNTLGIVAGLAMQQDAIIVDKHMQTSKNNIYAAGDCCIMSENNQQHGGTFLWADAVAQGITAAKNMYGIEHGYSFDGAMTVLTLANNTLASFGCVTKYTTLQQAVTKKDDNFWYIYYYTQSGQLCGVVALNSLKEAMQAKREITKEYI